MADAVAVDGDVERHRLVAHGDVAGVEGLAEGHGRIPLGLNRTDGDAVRVAGADAAILIPLGVAAGRRVRDEDVVHRFRFGRITGDTQAAGTAADGLVDHAVRDRTHRELVSRREGQTDGRLQRRLRGHAGRHADLALGSCPVGLHFLVRDRPVGEDPVRRLHPQVVRQQARRTTEPVPGRAAGDAFVGTAELHLAHVLVVTLERALRLDEMAHFGRAADRQRRRARSRQRGRIGERSNAGERAGGRRRSSGQRGIRRLRRFGKRQIEVLHVLLAAVRHRRSGLEDEHLLAGQAKLEGDGAARGAGADDDHVILRGTAAVAVAHCPPPVLTGALVVFTPKLSSDFGASLQ